MTDQSPTANRVIITVDSDRFSDATLEYAVTMAARLKRPLVGIFIEDTDLLSSAELPFSTEICLFTGQPRQFDRQRLQSALRDLANRFQHRLARCAEQMSVSWSVSSVRGRRRDFPLEQLTASDYCIYESGWVRRPARAPNRTRQLLVIDGHGEAFYHTLAALLAPLEGQRLQLTLVQSDGQPAVSGLRPLLPAGTRVNPVPHLQLADILRQAGNRFDYVVVSRRHWLAELAPQLARLNCPLILVE